MRRREVIKGITVGIDMTGPQNPSGSTPAFDVQSPSFDSILLSGLWFQVFDNRMEAVDVTSSGALSEPPEDLETALGDSDVFNAARNTFKTITVGGDESLILIAPFQLDVPRGAGSARRRAG